jgi:hypothetical protein
MGLLSSLGGGSATGDQHPGWPRQDHDKTRSRSVAIPVVSRSDSAATRIWSSVSANLVDSTEVTTGGGDPGERPEQFPGHADLVADLKKLREKGLTRLRGLHLPALERAAQTRGSLTITAASDPREIETLVADAIASLSSDELRTAALCDFGLTPGLRHKTSAVRRRHAADPFQQSPEVFRRGMEQTMMSEIAEAIINLAHMAGRSTDGAMNESDGVEMSTILSVLELLAGGGAVLGTDVFAVARAEVSERLWAQVKGRLARDTSTDDELIGSLDRGESVSVDTAIRLLSSLSADDLESILQHAQGLSTSKPNVVGSAFDQSSVNAGRDIIGGDRITGEREA